MEIVCQSQPTLAVETLKPCPMKFSRLSENFGTDRGVLSLARAILDTYLRTRIGTENAPKPPIQRLPPGVDNLSATSGLALRAVGCGGSGD